MILKGKCEGCFNVDESHVSLPQYRGMYAGDRARKEVLVDYGFRLPSALDNRPLMADEYINKAPYYLSVSATPAEYELEMSSVIAHQIIRLTGLLDLILEIKTSDNQVEDIYDEIKGIAAKNERNQIIRALRFNLICGLVNFDRRFMVIGK